MKGFGAVLLAASLGGCGFFSDKPVEICKDIARGTSVDPGSVRFNGVEQIKRPLSVDDLEKAWRKRGGGELLPSAQALLELYREDPSGLFKISVVIDYTAQSRSGLVRSEAICIYYAQGDRTELALIGLGNKDYSADELFNLLTGIKRPPGLGSANYVE